MGSKQIFLSLGALFLGVLAQAEPVDNWTNRPAVIRVADRLAENVEQFDESLHAVVAPKKVIELTHHFEETVAAFVEEVRVAPYSEVILEMAHIREDVEFIRQEIRKYPALSHGPGVFNSWNRMRSTYRELDHEMYAQIPEPGPGPGPGPGPTVLKLNGAEYQVLGQNELKSTESSVSGKGTMLFKDALPEEDNNFLLSFSLEESGSLTLSGNTDDKFTGGASVTFARQGKSLKVKLVAGETSDDLSEEFATVDASVPLKISVDIHGHGHLKVWVGEGEEQEYSFVAKLAGLRWGLSLNNATVTNAKPGEAHEEGEEDHDH